MKETEELLINVAELFSENEQVFRGLAMKLLKNQPDADDLLQDTAYRVMKNQDRYQAGTNFRAWACTIMRNIFINEFRKRKRRAIILEGSRDRDLNRMHSIQLRNDGELKLEEETILLVVERLGELYKRPFLLHFSGYSYQEIADRYALPLGTVKSRIHIARKKLRADLCHYYELDHHKSQIKH